MYLAAYGYLPALLCGRQVHDVIGEDSGDRGTG